MASHTGIFSAFRPSSREAAMVLRSTSLATATSMVALKDACESVFPGVFSGEVVGEKMYVPSGPSYR